MTQLRAYPVELEQEDLEILMVELSPHQMIAAMKAAGTDKNMSVAGIRTAREGLRMSVRKISGKDISYVDLEGAKWKKYFPRTRTTLQLAGLWTQIHEPSEDDLGSLEGRMSPTISDDEEEGEIWTFSLPDGRKIVMAEIDLDTVEQSLRQSENASKSMAAQGLTTAIQNIRTCLRSVDGKQIFPKDLKGRKWDSIFNVPDTMLLAHAFDVIHGGDSAGIKLGEANPVSGTK